MGYEDDEQFRQQMSGSYGQAEVQLGHEAYQSQVAVNTGLAKVNESIAEGNRQTTENSRQTTPVFVARHLAVANMYDSFGGAARFVGLMVGIYILAQAVAVIVGLF